MFNAIKKLIVSFQYNMLVNFQWTDNLYRKFWHSKTTEFVVTNNKFNYPS